MDRPVLHLMPVARIPAARVPAAALPVRPKRPHVAAGPPVSSRVMVHKLDSQALGRSLLYTGTAAGLLAAYGLVFLGLRRRLW